jgi:PII-like signaling protein
MQGICLKLFVSESRLHNGILLYEWLLEQAKEMGILGGTAIRAMAGFGRHGRLHEEAFFELAGELPVEIEFLVSEQQAERLLGLLKSENLRLFYARTPAEYGVTL